jgi:CMP-N,N'-diacetyllegionaminic acid synthase
VARDAERPVISNARVLAVITARGGSKGVPRKNIRDVGGRPLISWAIAAAQASRHIDRTIVSSDDDEIIAVAEAYGSEAPFVRSADLSGDHVPSVDVVIDAIERCPGHGWVVLLQPTSPLRTALDIDRALERCVAANAPACVSVCAVQESPYRMYTLRTGGRMTPLLARDVRRRQELPQVYRLNGAVYVARTDWLVRERTFLHDDTVAYEMPIERSVDVDTEHDFRLLDLFLRR